MTQEQEESQAKKDPVTDSRVYGRGTGLVTTLILIFVTLKLTGLIGWSWVWVLSPLWVSILFDFIVYTIIATAAAFAESKKNQK